MANKLATSFGPVPPLGYSTIFGVDIAKRTLNGNGVVVAAIIDSATLQQILNNRIEAGAPSTVFSSTAKATAMTKAEGGATAAGTAATTSKATKGTAASASPAKAKGTEAANAGPPSVVAAIVISSAETVQSSLKAAKAKGTVSASVISSVALFGMAADISTGKAGKLKGGNAAFNSSLKTKNIWSWDLIGIGR